jgi:hypothetical protein
VPPPRPSAVVSGRVPLDLEDIVMRCLAKHATSRPRDAHALDAMLAACADAGRWTEDLAARWWTEKWPELEAARAVAVAAGGAQAETPTLVIDREARSAG